MSPCLSVLIAIFMSLRCASGSALVTSSRQIMRRDRDWHLSIDSVAHAIEDGLFSRAELSTKLSEACEELKERRFSFQDSARCGPDPIHYGFQELLDAYKVEMEYWSQQGSSNPWWAVLTNYQQGVEVPVDKKLEFYQSGAADIQRQVSAFEKMGLKDMLPADKAVALDLGCGMGRMSVGLVATMGFQKVMCVDQAQTMLDAAKTNLQELSGQGVIPADVMSRIEFVQSPPNLLCSVAGGQMDYVQSIITLQHMKPQLQVAYIEQMCDSLRIGGAGFFQIPVESQRESNDAHCTINTENFEMAMHYTPKAEVVRHLEARGCKVLMTMPMNAIGDFGKDLGFAFHKDTNSVF